MSVLVSHAIFIFMVFVFIFIKINYIIKLDNPSPVRSSFFVNMIQAGAASHPLTTLLEPKSSFHPLLFSPIADSQNCLPFCWVEGEQRPVHGEQNSPSPSLSQCIPKHLLPGRKWHHSAGIQVINFFFPHHSLPLRESVFDLSSKALGIHLLFRRCHQPTREVKKRASYLVPGNLQISEKGS